MIALRRASVVLATLVAEVVAVVALLAAGRRRELAVPLAHLDRWLRERPPDDVVVALLRWVALLVAVWLLVSTLLYVLVAASRVPAAVRAVRWSTLPAVRRAVDTAFAMSVVTGAVLASGAPAAAATGGGDATPVTLVRDGRSGHLSQLPPDSTGPRPPSPPSTTVVPVPPAAEPAPAPAAAPELPARAQDVVVEAGDNLWELAARQLAALAGRSRADVGDREIAPYWARVCEANRSRLLSGDPNLIHPGERIVLPPVS